MQQSRVRAAFAMALALWVIATGMTLLRQQTSLLGDGSEYAVMLMAWSRHASPGITPEDVAAYNAMIASKPLPDSAQMTPSLDPWLEVRGPGGQRWDMRHFWFYSLLALPFMPIANLLGLHPLAAFALLNAALALAAILIARRWSGDAGALAAALVLVCSPVLWFSNKVHAEPLIVCAVLVAFIGAAAGRTAWAGFVLALAAAQNNLLAPFVALLFGWAWFIEKSSRRTTLILAAASSALVALSPAYYWLRHGFTSPLTHLGYVHPALLGWKRILTLWIDPDRGLLLLWPLALPCLAVALARLRRERIRLDAAILFAAAYLLLTQIVVGMQVNWNPGASHLVHRYSVWFIPLAWFPLRRWIEFANEAAGWRRTAAASTLLLLSGWSAFEQRPSQPDTVIQFNALSRWIYSHYPDLYDPDPEVFLERACGSELGGYSTPLRRVDRARLQCLGGTALSKGFWAASDPACRKIYISREGLQEQASLPAPAPIAGCAASVDSRLLLKMALTKAPGGSDDFFFTTAADQAVLPPGR